MSADGIKLAASCGWPPVQGETLTNAKIRKVAAKPRLKDFGDHWPKEKKVKMKKFANPAKAVQGETNRPFSKSRRKGRVAATAPAPPARDGLKSTGHPERDDAPGIHGGETLRARRREHDVGRLLRRLVLPLWHTR